MLHRLLEWDFYASVLNENPPAPENKSINFKKSLLLMALNFNLRFLNLIRCSINKGCIIL